MTTQRMTKLKPCPFCGGRAVHRPWIGERSSVVGAEPHFIRCDSCKSATKLFDLREEAEATWNRRSDDVNTATLRVAP